MGLEICINKSTFYETAGPVAFMHHPAEKFALIID
jgi:hypothetical protein